MSSRFPWFPLITSAATGLGLFGLFWYDSLGSEDKRRADGLAADYARQLYGCTVEELTATQRGRVNNLVKADLAN
ncbi:MAG TPA: hypothetical protein VMG10_12270 [Gemmataceae bacterium]|nr:hypothetical protein [Gemmataceae bacterium]